MAAHPPRLERRPGGFPHSSELPLLVIWRSAGQCGHFSQLPTPQISFPWALLFLCCSNWIPLWAVFPWCGALSQESHSLLIRSFSCSTLLQAPIGTPRGPLPPAHYFNGQKSNHSEWTATLPGFPLTPWLFGFFRLQGCLLSFVLSWVFLFLCFSNYWEGFKEPYSLYIF